MNQIVTKTRTNSIKIRLQEGNEPIAQSLAETLTAPNSTVDLTADGQTGWDFVKATVNDSMLLNLMMPSINGISLFRKLRASALTRLILMLTIKDTSTEQAIELDAGADNAVMKLKFLEAGTSI